MVDRPLDHFYILILDRVDIMPGIQRKQEHLYGYIGDEIWGDLGR